MIPGAGLYLPDSLYSTATAYSETAESRSIRRKYFERKTTNRERTSSDCASIAFSSLTRSSDDVSRVFSSLSTVFDFADFAGAQEKISSENETFVNLIQRVRQDVSEAERLSTSHAVTDYLESWPDKKTWIESILLDVHRALNDIGVYVESVRVSGDDGGTAGLRRKFEWVMSHHKKLINKKQYLMLCHSSLMVAVQLMQAAEMNGAFGHDPIYEAPAQPWVQQDGRGILPSPHSRQKWRMSQRNLSLPSIMVSEEGIDKAEMQSVNSMPAELPGSTPDDLPDPQNFDLYAPPPKPRASSMDAARCPSSSPRSGEEGSNSPSTLAPTWHSVEERPIRRYLDGMRRDEPTDHERPRTSSGQARPRAFSDQVRPQRPFEVQARASFDQVRRMPTLNEKSIDRNGSNSSVSVKQADTMPLSRLRYRAKAVQVRKPPAKHRSLPSQLPSLPSQSSLINELSDWILPSAIRDSYQSTHSTDTSTTQEASTPATSVASSPLLISSPASCPVGFGGLDSGANTPVGSDPSPIENSDSALRPVIPVLPSHASSHASTRERGRPTAPILEESEEQAATDSGAQALPAAPRISSSDDPSVRTDTTVKSSSESTTLKPLPSEETLTPSHDKSITQSTTSASETETPPPLPPRPATMNIRSPQHATSSDLIPVSQARPSPKFVVEPETCEKWGKLVEANQTEATNYEASPEPTSKSGEAQRAEGAKVEHVKSTAPQPTTQSTTAQARRRAAHARRMQLAYGTD